MTAETVSIAVKQLDHGKDLPLPEHATALSAGVDLLAAIREDLILKPGTHTLVPTGLSIALPAGFEAQVRPRSGLANNHRVTVLNSPGTIDADYRGEICVMLINHSSDDFVITRGLRIAQMVVARVAFVHWQVTDQLATSERGSGGFGSTGTHSLKV
ncbi:MAG: dUTP diphosphatase [Rhodospirillaceae bacterium]|nr:MAG: dUTP diphosphatase [Rhodospirillaceae bacterium]